MCRSEITEIRQEKNPEGRIQIKSAASPPRSSAPWAAGKERQPEHLRGARAWPPGCPGLSCPRRPGTQSPRAPSHAPAGPARARPGWGPPARCGGAQHGAGERAAVRAVHAAPASTDRPNALRPRHARHGGRTLRAAAWHSRAPVTEPACAWPQSARVPRTSSKRGPGVSYSGEWQPSTSGQSPRAPSQEEQQAGSKSDIRAPSQKSPQLPRPLMTLTHYAAGLRRSPPLAPLLSSVLLPAPCPPCSLPSGMWPRHSLRLRDLGNGGTSRVRQCGAIVWDP